MDGLPWNCTSKLLSMAWHPDETVLVLGSDTGELFSISWEKEIQKERKFPLVHKHAVKYMSWANDTQFISLDTVCNNTLNISTKFNFSLGMTVRKLHSVELQW